MAISFELIRDQYHCLETDSPDDFHSHCMREFVQIEINWEEAPESMKDVRDLAPEPLETILYTPYPTSVPEDNRDNPIEPIVEPAVDFYFDEETKRTEGTLAEFLGSREKADRVLYGLPREISKGTGHAWSHLGMEQRARVRDGEIVMATDVAEKHRRGMSSVKDGYHFEIDPDGKMRQRSIADTPVGTLGIAFLKDYLDEHYPGGHTNYPNQHLLYQLEFGYRVPGDRAWSLAIGPPLASALPHLDIIEDQIQEQIDKGWYQASPCIRAIPAMYPPSGAVAQNDKIRITSDLSAFRDLFDEEGRPVSANEASRRADEEKDRRWTSIRNFLLQAEISFAFFEELRRRLTPERLRELDVEPRSFGSDIQSMYRQFKVANLYKYEQGMMLSRAPTAPGASPTVEALDTDRITFGGSNAPWFCSEGAKVQDCTNMLGAGRYESLIRKRAREGCEVARLIFPPELEELVELRRQSLGKEQDLLFHSLQYIDDRKGDGVGSARTLHGNWLGWQQALPEELGLTIGMPKGAFGPRIDCLGVEFLSSKGGARTFERRMNKINALTDRAVSLRQIEHPELSSLVGKYGHVAMVEQGVATAIARLRRVVAIESPRVRRLWSFRKGQGELVLQMQEWVKEDLERARTLMNRNRGMPFSSVPITLSIRAHRQALSDSNRCLSLRKYSGMGGFVSLPGGVIKYWFYPLSDFLVCEETGLPVHLTERIAPAITIALNPELQHCDLVQLLDNASAVSCLDSRSASDSRFQDLNLMTEWQLEDRQIRTETRWISTHMNLWADLLSRGEIAKFRRLASAAGATELVEQDVQALGSPADLPGVLDRMQKMTMMMPRAYRSGQPARAQPTRLSRGDSQLTTTHFPTFPHTRQIQGPPLREDGRSRGQGRPAREQPIAATGRRERRPPATRRSPSEPKYESSQ